MKNCFLIYITFLLYFQTAISQNEEKESDATWEETVAWINSKLTTKEMTKEYTYAWISGSMFSVGKKSNRSYGLNKSTTHYEVNINLLISCHRYDSNEIWLNFPEKVKQTHNVIKDNGAVNSSIDWHDYVLIKFRDIDLAKRLEKAFNHLAKLAKAKRDNEASTEKF
ncbi:hypothetical protein [Aequorivita nionensis]|uniref:hypothetical protein n=1 Tax=Aequorivita nionensis TaxID=1287690 RepID=UPI003965977B